ncbi:MAG: hypothetical protein E6J72_04720 [Deltaproteobacteria bacterium]|nr:MAG: hypothetical protein E6J72_04720 [Deltaproteobacteria bacterium]
MLGFSRWTRRTTGSCGTASAASDGRWLRGGRASLFILERIGWPRLARVAALPPLVWLVEAAYALVAHNRAFFSRLLPRTRSA